MFPDRILSLLLSTLLCCSSGYRISWEEYNRTNTRVTHYLANVTLEYKVTGLTALTTYTIEVAGMTSKGQGQLSSSTISSGVPPGQHPNRPTQKSAFVRSVVSGSDSSSPPSSSVYLPSTHPVCFFQLEPTLCVLEPVCFGSQTPRWFKVRCIELNGTCVMSSKDAGVISVYYSWCYCIRVAHSTKKTPM